MSGWFSVWFHNLPTEQCFARDGAGVLVFEFDNSFSYWRAKQLSFDVITTHRESAMVTAANDDEMKSSLRGSTQTSLSKATHEELGRDTERQQLGDYTSSNNSQREASNIGTSARQPQRGLWDETEYEKKKHQTQQKMKQPQQQNKKKGFSTMLCCAGGGGSSR